MDEDKLTFIILADRTPGESVHAQLVEDLQMIGDVNMFFNGDIQDEEDFTAEMEIMIAGNVFRLCHSHNTSLF